MRGEHRRFPHLAFFHLAVAEKRKSVPVLAGKPRRQGKTDRARQTLSERTADQIAQRRALAADGLKVGSVAAIGGEFRRIDQSGFGSRGVKRDHVMPRREHEPVVAIAHAAAEQHRENLGG